MTARARLRRLLAAVALAIAVVGCDPATGSPNCPPGQWYVEKPGAGWTCAPGSPGVFTPGADFAPASPKESAP